MSAVVLDFESAARLAKVAIFVRAITACNIAWDNGYTAEDVARVAPEWTYAMWTGLTAFASELEGRRIEFPSEQTRADVIAEFRKLAAAAVVARKIVEHMRTRSAHVQVSP